LAAIFRDRRLVVGTNVGHVDEGRADRDAALLYQFQQALPDAPFGSADEQLRS
jgi:hypothetical protein